MLAKYKESPCSFETVHIQYIALTGVLNFVDLYNALVFCWRNCLGRGRSAPATHAWISERRGGRLEKTCVGVCVWGTVLALHICPVSPALSSTGETPLCNP